MSREHEGLRALCDFTRVAVRIDELVPVEAPWIEPCLDCHRRAGLRWIELEDHISLGIHTLDEHRLCSSNQLVAIFPEDLHEVPVRLGVHQFERVGARRKRCPRDHHRSIEFQGRPVVPLVGAGDRGECQDHDDRHRRFGHVIGFLLS